MRSIGSRFATAWIVVSVSFRLDVGSVINIDFQDSPKVITTNTRKTHNLYVIVKSKRKEEILRFHCIPMQPVTERPK